YTGKIFVVGLVLFISFLTYNLYHAPGDGIEEIFINLLRQYGYIILFVWSMLEGEMGLIMAGLLSHDGSMNVLLAIFVAGLGGFAGDQVYFYIGRFNKTSVLKRLRGQRRKFAFAHLLLKKHGWPIIFTQ
ncbi:DedA family protein, partial [Aliarcobacter lanthieri]|uniref:DedA family protein n=1 Tax=Aliarcobacter lanthieri TaxID=1355374 RepID=UPI003AA86744